MSRSYNVIDADGHVLEPFTLWNDYMDPQYRERAPKLDLKRTLSRAVTEWLASLKAQGSRSLSIYTRRMNQAILPVLGSVSVARITSANVIRWRDNYVREVSPATVNATIGTLSSAFEWFGTMQWVDENPVHGVKRFEENTPQFEWLRTPSRSRDCWRRVPSRSARSSP